MYKVCKTERSIERQKLFQTTLLAMMEKQHFQDITGRVTNANIFGVDKPIVRCQIDGVQQLGRPLTKADIVRMGHFMSDTYAMKGFALSMAVKHFATDLYTNAQEQSKGMKR